MVAQRVPGRVRGNFDMVQARQIRNIYHGVRSYLGLLPGESPASDEGGVSYADLAQWFNTTIPTIHHIVQGHTYPEPKGGKPKDFLQLTPEDKVEIIRYYKQGMKKQAIARNTLCSLWTVQLTLAEAGFEKEIAIIERHRTRQKHIDRNRPSRGGKKGKKNVKHTA